MKQFPVWATGFVGIAPVFALASTVCTYDYITVFDKGNNEWGWH